MSGNERPCLCEYWGREECPEHGIPPNGWRDVIDDRSDGVKVLLHQDDVVTHRWHVYPADERLQHFAVGVHCDCPGLAFRAPCLECPNARRPAPSCFRCHGTGVVTVGPEYDRVHFVVHGRDTVIEAGTDRLNGVPLNRLFSPQELGEDDV